MGSMRRDGQLEFAVVHMSSLPPSLLQEACNVASASMRRSEDEVEVARNLKNHFDERYGGNWHCIVGRNFGSFVTYDDDNLCYFKVGKTSVLLFRTYTQLSQFIRRSP
uniref:Dynein light chain n=1 Tax=Steinernema glaseri TaxID=37863 RepID=A0A1I7ZXM6_9BILA